MEGSVAVARGLARQVGRAGWHRRREAMDAHGLDALRSEVEVAVAARRWQEVRRLSAAIAPLAVKSGNAQLVNAMGQAHERLGDFRKAAELRLGARRLRRPGSRPEWNGEDISDKTLFVNLVEDDPSSLGRVIRHARLAGLAVNRAKRTIIRVEARMAPLLLRSFPAAEIVAADVPAETIAADVVAGFEHLASIFAADWDALAASFVPLRPAPDVVASLRKTYSAAGTGPLIGISWGSKSEAKDVPDFGDWSQLMAEVPATHVSLQYGRIDAALVKLRQGGKLRLIDDASVDQLIDMDRFAAQIAALDAVVTISNTGAHLAGALGVRTIFLVDDKFHTVWPVIGNTTPWYPSGTVVRKDGRDWREALGEVGARLSALLGIRA